MFTITLIIAKIISFITGAVGGGTNLPGVIALKLRPSILKELCRGYRVILVTGTNGKTTTTSMIRSIIEKTGVNAINSDSGANMKAGIVSYLTKMRPLFKKVEGEFAVLEVDEAYMRFVTADIEPEIVAVTNIFRDQLDRYGEVDHTFALIEEACKNAPGATLVLNADEAMLGDFMPGNPRFYYGFRIPASDEQRPVTNAEGKFCKKCRAPYHYNFVTFNHLGDFECPDCMYKRPELNLGVERINCITADYSNVDFDGINIVIPQPGVYNIYNALCAAACAKALNIADEHIKNGIQAQGSRFGRQETVKIGNCEMRIILFKNPAGATEAINSVLPDKDSVTLGVLLNDRLADGTDVSWIYDVEFDRLLSMNYKKIIAGGIRAFDMAIRLETGGFRNIDVKENFDNLLEEIKNTEGRLYLFTTYTAMITFRKYLYNKKHIKKIWY